MMKEFKSFTKYNFEDSQIMTIGWDKSGDNLWIQFILADEKEVKLSFIWTTELVIDVTFNEYSGMPLVFNTTFEHINDEFWIVEIIFGAAPEGKMMFKCNEIEC